MEADQRPSRIRYGVVGVTTLTAVLLYLDRYCFGILFTYMREDLSLTSFQVGTIGTSFFFSYALAQVPSGWFSDRFGPRIMLTAYIVLWSLFTGLLGLAVGGITLLAFRMLQGVTQAGAYPTSANLLSRWVPLAARGTASSIVSSGGRLGGVLAPGLTGLLILLLVPIEVSSEFTAEQIIHPPRLCYLLSKGEQWTLEGVRISKGDSGEAAEEDSAEEKSDGDPALEIVHLQAAKWLWPQFDAETRTAVEREASLAVEQVKASLEVPPGERDLVTPGLRDELTAQINAALDKSGLYEEQFFSEVRLEDEAERLLGREWSELTEQEKQRLNRLLLEAAFPDSLGKVYGAGWRPVVLIYGIAGLVVAAIFWTVFRNRPQEHLLCNEREVALIQYGRKKTAEVVPQQVGGVPLLELVRSVSMWLNCLMQFTINFGWLFVPFWLPEYLAQEHQVPLGQRLMMAQIPMIVGWIGMMLGGPLTDGLVKAMGLRRGRNLPMSASKFVALAAYGYLYLFEQSPWSAVIAFSVVAFSTDIGVPAIWAYMQDVGGRHVGSILGWGNMWGNFGAFAAGPVIGWVVMVTQGWSGAFLFGATAFLISGIAALGIDPTKPVVPEEEDEDDASDAAASEPT